VDFLSGETANPRMLKERRARCRAEKRTSATWADRPSQEGGNPLKKVLDVIMTEPGNVTQLVTVTDNSGGR
jgi:hypothetical protein